MGTPFDTEVLATAALRHVGAKVASGAKMDDVVNAIAPKQLVNSAIVPLLARWVEIFRKRVDQGNRQPRTFADYERWSGPANNRVAYFSYWYGKTTFDVDRAKLEEWSFWLTERRLSQKTARNVMAGFHRFLMWVADDVRPDYKVPRFPWPEPDEHLPTIIDQGTQMKLIHAIPDEKQGIFWSLAECLLRPSEARVLRVRDWNRGEIHVSRAAKDRRVGGLIRGLKKRNVKTMPVESWMLGEWLDRHVPKERRLSDPDGPLFVNPDGEEKGGWFSESTMRRIWRKACKDVGVSVGMYEGTKHSTATYLKGLGADDRLLAKLMGHRDPKSVEKYAKLGSAAIREGLVRLRRKPGDGS